MNNDLFFRTQYKLIPFLATLYIAVDLCVPLVSNKYISAPIGIMPVGCFAAPFWFLLGDMIAETYGFKMVMRFFWSMVIAEFLFALVCQLLKNLPSPTFWQGQSYYEFALGQLIHLNIWSVTAITLAWRMNAYLLTKWKILTRGKYFWLRSVGSSAIGETLFGLMMAPAWFVFGPTTEIHQVVSILIWSLTTKISLTAILAVPGSFIVKLFKIIEQVDVYEYQLEFNPFKKKSEV